MKKYIVFSSANTTFSNTNDLKSMFLLFAQVFFMTRHDTTFSTAKFTVTVLEGALTLLFESGLRFSMKENDVCRTKWDLLPGKVAIKRKIERSCYYEQKQP